MLFTAVTMPYRRAILTLAACALITSVVAVDPALQERYGKPSLYATFEGQRVVTYAGVPNNDTLATEIANGALMNQTLASLLPGDILVIPNNTYHVMGGISSTGLVNVTISFEGTLVYSKSMKAWPRSTPGSKGKVLPCMKFEQATNLRLVGVEGGSLFDGNGAVWWGFPGIGYLLIGENRPQLLVVDHCTNVLVENVILKNSPYYSFLGTSAQGMEIRDSSVNARRDNDDGHDILDLTAFNTDGFDVTGRDVWIHDVTVWNQDDCVAVKDNSQNMLIERVNASGLGMTIGSIGGSLVRNITFRDIVMPHTFKGIYMKFRSSGVIEDVLYENITMYDVEQYPIWIGPAQQSDSSDLCAAHPCSLCWPLLAPYAQCNCPEQAFYRNITLRNIQVLGSKNSPGVIMANSSCPMTNIVFDNVVVQDAGDKPFGTNYKCEGVASGIATGGTNPVPSCFQQV